MKNRFKFRFWFKDTQEMIYSEKFNDVQTLGQWLFGDRKDVVKMQCTGIKDKNCKLIYEGDIVQTTFGDNSKIIFYVIWNNENALFNGKIIKKGKTNAFCINEDYLYYLLANGIDEKTEVIGNIYENPELLKE